MKAHNRVWEDKDFGFDEGRAWGGSAAAGAGRRWGGVFRAGTSPLENNL